MSRSTDPGHFFQTDTSEAARVRKAEKSGNKNGNPIKLQSKILDVIADPISEDCVYIAESAGCVRRVNTKTRDTKTIFRGPTAPITSTAISGHNGSKLFAGCWDKDIWIWETSTQKLLGRYQGHTDFVKTLIPTTITSKEILISGGADSRIMIWDTTTGQRIHTLRDTEDTLRAVQHIALDPLHSTPNSLSLYSASSDPLIRNWIITIDSAKQGSSAQAIQSSTSPKNNSTPLVSANPSSITRTHETSVYKILFDPHDDDDCDIWTASADGTAKQLSRSQNFGIAVTTLPHDDYVRAIALTSEFVITAGRSEDIKIWDRGSAELVHVFEGHFEEVTGLVVIGRGRVLISVGIDGTVRRWGILRTDVEMAKREVEMRRVERERGEMVVVETKPKKGLMTAEEEAELAELMDSD